MNSFISLCLHACPSKCCGCSKGCCKGPDFGPSFLRFYQLHFGRATSQQHCGFHCRCGSWLSASSCPKSQWCSSLKRLKWFEFLDDSIKKRDGKEWMQDGNRKYQRIWKSQVSWFSVKSSRSELAKSYWTRFETGTLLHLVSTRPIGKGLPCKIRRETSESREINAKHQFTHQFPILFFMS